MSSSGGYSSATVSGVTVHIVHAVDVYKSTSRLSHMTFLNILFLFSLFLFRFQFELVEEEVGGRTKENGTHARVTPTRHFLVHEVLFNSFGVYNGTFGTLCCRDALYYEQTSCRRFCRPLRIRLLSIFFLALTLILCNGGNIKEQMWKT